MHIVHHYFLLPSGSYPGWWLSPTPLKNHGVRQLGLLVPIYGKIKINSCSKPPTRFLWISWLIYALRFLLLQIPMLAKTPCRYQWQKMCSFVWTFLCRRINDFLIGFGQIIELLVSTLPKMWKLTNITRWNHQLNPVPTPSRNGGRIAVFAPGKKRLYYTYSIITQPPKKMKHKKHPT